MDMDVNKKVILLVFLLLTACGLVRVRSYVEFAGTEQDSMFLSEIRSKIEARIEGEAGGSCYTPGWGDYLYICNTKSKMLVSVGFASVSGNVFINIDSSKTFVLPSSKDALEAGKFLSTEHRDWESWINIEFANYELVEKARRTTGGIVQEF